MPTRDRPFSLALERSVRLLTLAVLSVGFLASADAADPDIAWINSLKCSDLITADGTIDQDQLQHFRPWLLGFVMGASSAGPVNITRHVEMADAGAAVLTFCQKHRSETVVSAAVNALAFFSNLLDAGHSRELVDPSPAQ